MSSQQPLSSVYEPDKVENKWYEYWKEKGYFKPREDSQAKTFSIVMPPPNVTGSLHLGHALDNTLQDILTRWRRMQGYRCLWLPGTDHAGIATQAKVEESLAAEGLSKHDLGREKFLERVWEWKNNYGDKIINQLSLMGSSCDWSRTRFTMDADCSSAVREVFVNLYNKGLIYQGDYIINWCPRCDTAISDIEVQHEDRSGHLFHIKYPLENSAEYLVVATTRPETMLGDSGVAVHPDDERYRSMIGKQVRLPIMDRLIPIFADDYVESDFGSGAVKVTPSHDPNDFEMGLRHNLEQISIMDNHAIMNENAGKYKGLDRYECRKQLLADLEEKGFLIKVEDHQHAIGQCQRCETIIEPLISKQWFVSMKPLAEPALRSVVNGDIRFVPERFTKIYCNWMEGIRDWCISRQLWWGHRIPVWYCQECEKVICAKVDPEQCPQCGSINLVQDEDVLDTWFSSALWPFSTLGWPQETEDFSNFYPTSVLVTGRDIIFFWVARMIFSGLEHTGKIPFFDVNIHGLILDGQGRKMSKSLGNGVDPLDIIAKYGADTLRFSLITGVTPGNDVRFHLEKVENTRNFANKLWNAARFVLMNMEGFKEIVLDQDHLQLVDKWILSRAEKCKIEVTKCLENYEMGEAAQIIYDFCWDDYCDWYIELTKSRLAKNAAATDKLVAQNVLNRVLEVILKLLHPFMPFITEEIYQKLSAAKESIMISAWPTIIEELISEDVEMQMNHIMTIIRALRNIRGEFNIAPNAKIEVIAVPSDNQALKLIEDNAKYIKVMAGVESINCETSSIDPPKQAGSVQLSQAVLYVPLEGIIDIAQEMERLNKNLVKSQKEIDQSDGKLKNEKFVAQAPPEIIAKEKAKLEEAQKKKEGILLRLQLLKN